MTDEIRDERFKAKRFTSQELRFIEAYLGSPERSISAANKAAGFTPGGQGYNREHDEIYKREHVQEEIRYREEMRKCRKHVSIDKVVNWLQQCVARCMQKSKVYDKDGKFTGTFKFMPTPAIRGCEVLLKYLGVRAFQEDNRSAERLPSLAEVMQMVMEAQKRLIEDGNLQPIVIMQNAQSEVHDLPVGTQGPPPDAICESLEDRKEEPVPPEDAIPDKLSDRHTASARNITEYLKEIQRGQLGMAVD